MSIIVNGITIPTNGDYIKVGSTLVDKVDVVYNGIRTTVWEKMKGNIFENGEFMPGITWEGDASYVNPAADASGAEAPTISDKHIWAICTSKGYGGHGDEFSSNGPQTWSKIIINNIDFTGFNTLRIVCEKHPTWKMHADSGNSRIRCGFDSNNQAYTLVDVLDYNNGRGTFPPPQTVDIDVSSVTGIHSLNMLLEVSCNSTSLTQSSIGYMYISSIRLLQ